MEVTGNIKKRAGTNPRLCLLGFFKGDLTPQAHLRFDYSIEVVAHSGTVHIDRHRNIRVFCAPNDTADCDMFILFGEL